MTKYSDLVPYNPYSVHPYFGGRLPLVVTAPLNSHSTNEPKFELLSAVPTGNRICHRRKMYAALYMHTCAEKKTYFGKDD